MHLPYSDKNTAVQTKLRNKIVDIKRQYLAVAALMMKQDEMA